MDHTEVVVSLSVEEFSEIYKHHMIQDFPVEELKPLQRITDTMCRGFCEAFAYYREGRLAGYAVCIVPEQTEHLLLDYFAVVSGSRGQGMGSRFFELLLRYLHEIHPQKQGVFIECESVESAVNEIQENQRRSRIRFYKRCGCAQTLLKSELFGVEYVILHSGFSGACIPVHRRQLDAIYRKMFKKKHYQNRVKLWERLGTDILSMDARKMAPFLLGKFLCRRVDGAVLKYRITETECYCGEKDTACHAHHGKTERTKVLYEKGGIAYVYLCYGIHSLFNVVSGREGYPEAVLIRGVEGYDGPGRLTKAMHIDRTLNGIDMTLSEELWLEDDGTQFSYVRGKRIGIDYATKRYRDVLWRFTALPHSEP